MVVAATLLPLSLHGQRTGKKRPTPTEIRKTPTPAIESWGDEVNKLAREALGRGSFETAARLFSLLEEDPRWESDPRFAFNRAQASRYANDPGESVYWYSRYLALDPGATDAKQVSEQIEKLSKGGGKSMRAAALKRVKAEAEHAFGDFELGRALYEAPQVKLQVRFVKAATPDDPSVTTFGFPGRAVFWRALEGDTPGATWEVWVVASVPVAAPESLNAPLLILPPCRPFPVKMGTNLVAPSVRLEIEPLPFFPAAEELAEYRIEVAVELDRNGPPLLLGPNRTGPVMVEVKSGPADGPIAAGKKRRELPAYPMPISFGPRPARPDSKVFPGVPLVVFDLPGKDGDLERWGAPIGAVDVVNRFGKLGDGGKVYVRPDGTGPFLAPLGVGKKG